MQQQTLDLLVIGGGINGTGIARDAAGRGLTVLLCEQDDLGAHTSSASTKLIHGGLRYLEQHDYRLVRKALKEREVLLRAAPHIIWPLRFVIPHEPGLRPRWLLRAGLFLYDHLGGRELLPPSRGIRLGAHPAGTPLKPCFTHGFEYSDCWVQDSRLVVLNAMDAQRLGAMIHTRTACIAARRRNAHWEVDLRDQRSGHCTTVNARALVNAGGPWVEQLLRDTLRTPRQRHVRLVKGSHIVVPRLYEHPMAYTFQRPDGRLVFTIPYEQRYTLIGTTDVAHDTDPASAAITEAEVTYLCDAVNRYFVKGIEPGDVVWSFAGVRPLFDDAAAKASHVTRDYVLDLDAGAKGAPLLSVFGGKITTYRRLAEDALALLQPPLGHRAAPWTAGTHLPGGDLAEQDVAQYTRRLAADYPFLPPGAAERYTRHYGSRSRVLLGAADTVEALGRHFGADLFEAELRYLRDHEWAETADDVLWRRTRLGLHLPESARTAVAGWFARRRAAG